MNNTTVVKCEKGTGTGAPGTVTTWFPARRFQCSRCPVETDRCIGDRGIKVRVDGVSMTLCRKCYKELIENRCTVNR